MNQEKWTTYANFVNIILYNDSIEEMIETGAAVRLKDPSWMNRAWIECDESSAVGCKANHKLIQPDMCIFGDRAAILFAYLFIYLEMSFKSFWIMSVLNSSTLATPGELSTFF